MKQFWEKFDEAEWQAMFGQFFNGSEPKSNFEWDQVRFEQRQAHREPPFIFNNEPGVMHRILSGDTVRTILKRLRLMPHPDEIHYHSYRPAKPVEAIPEYRSYAEHLKVCKACEGGGICQQANDFILRNVPNLSYVSRP